MKKGLNTYTTVYGIALIIVSFAILYATFNDGINYSGMFKDPIAVLDGHPLSGFISNVGVVAWTIGATVALFCYFILGRNGYSTPTVKFLKWAGILTSVLLLDDLFMLHETKSTPLPGVPEEVWYVGYLLSISLIFYYFRKLLFKQKNILLFVSLFLLGLSIVTDVLLDHIPIFGILEDIFKYFGIVSWTLFLVETSVHEFQQFVVSFSGKDLKTGKIVDSRTS
jgi:hypothetical protein